MDVVFNHTAEGMRKVSLYLLKELITASITCLLLRDSSDVTAIHFWSLINVKIC